jgi:hypothetical protein
MLNKYIVEEMKRVGWKFRHVDVPNLGISCIGVALEGKCRCASLTTAGEIIDASKGKIKIYAGEEVFLASTKDTYGNDVRFYETHQEEAAAEALIYLIDEKIIEL